VATARWKLWMESCDHNHRTTCRLWHRPEFWILPQNSCKTSCMLMIGTWTPSPFCNHHSTWSDTAEATCTCLLSRNCSIPSTHGVRLVNQMRNTEW